MNAPGPSASAPPTITTRDEINASRSRIYATLQHTCDRRRRAILEQEIARLDAALADLKD